MGQGFVLANLDKKEFVSPHDLGLGYKIGEFGHPNPIRDFDGSLVHFARVLTAVDGKWHGDRVFYFGDYGDTYDLKFNPVTEIANQDGYNYSLAFDTFTRLDTAEVREWVEANGELDGMEHRRRFWAMMDKVEGTLQ